MSQSKRARYTKLAASGLRKADLTDLLIAFGFILFFTGHALTSIEAALKYGGAMLVFVGIVILIIRIIVYGLSSPDDQA